MRLAVSRNSSLKGKFDLDDFRKQLGSMKKMGSVRDLMSKIPGMGQMGMENLAGVDAG